MEKPKKKMGRPPSIPNCVIISIRFDEREFERLREIAAIETLNTDRITSAHQLIRDAVAFAYGDNERLRETFVRARQCGKRKNDKYRSNF